MTAPAGWVPLNGAHYLHPQKTSRIPRRYVFFDTEAHRDSITGGESQRWRLGVTARVKWREQSQTWSPVEPVRHNTQDSLIDHILDYGRKDARTVVVAHNLAYDVRISGLLPGLLGRGWRVERPTFTSEHVSFEAVRDRVRLVFVDSLSLLPKSISALGGLLGVPKMPLPDEDSSEPSWWARCESDVRILARAYMAVIEWLRANDLGGWARTGAAIGWHTLLRSHLAHKVLVHSSSNVRDAEATAMYAGRAEVWKHGVLATGPYHEWDYKTAYGRICAEVPLPAQYRYEVRNPSLPGLRTNREVYAYLCHARISQDVPVLPARDGAGIFWPTGTFEGWFWDNELSMAIEAGARVAVSRAFCYSAQPWLASWARWTLDLVDRDATPEERIVALVAKHWTRAVPGRTSMKYRAWEQAGAAWAPGVSYMPLLDISTGNRGAALTLGDRHWEAWRTEWWAEALPQVLSYVMAEARVRLWEAMQVAGLEEIVYVDTDSLIVTATGHRRLDLAVRSSGLGSLRYKAEHRLLELVAPQLVEGSTYRRLSGVPRGARRTSQSTYNGEVWEGITASFNEGHPDRVVVRNTGFTIEGIDTRRLHLPGHETAPFHVTNGVRSPNVELAS